MDNKPTEKGEWVSSGEKARYLKLKSKDAGLWYTMQLTCERISNLSTLLENEKKKLDELVEARKQYHAELLELQAKHDYINDTAADSLTPK